MEHREHLSTATDANHAQTEQYLKEINFTSEALDCECSMGTRPNLCPRKGFAVPWLLPFAHPLLRCCHDLFLNYRRWWSFSSCLTYPGGARPFLCKVRNNPYTFHQRMLAISRSVVQVIAAAATSRGHAVVGTNSRRAPRPDSWTHGLMDCWETYVPANQALRVGCCRLGLLLLHGIHSPSCQGNVLGALFRPWRGTEPPLLEPANPT